MVKRSLEIRDVNCHELTLLISFSIMGIDPWRIVNNWIPISWQFNLSQHNQLPLPWSNWSWEEVRFKFLIQGHTTSRISTKGGYISHTNPKCIDQRNHERITLNWIIWILSQVHHTIQIDPILLPNVIESVKHKSFLLDKPLELRRKRIVINPFK